MTTVTSRPEIALPSRADYVAVDVTQLTVGARLKQPVFDPRPGSDQLLLAAGKQLLPLHVKGLLQRGIHSVLLHRGDWERLRERTEEQHPRRSRTSRSTAIQRSGRDPATTPVAVAGWAGWRVTAQSFLNEIRRPVESHRSREKQRKVAEAVEGSVRRVTQLMTGLIREGSVNTDAAINICNVQLQQVADDIDEFVSAGIQPVLADYPSRHSVQTAMLATSLGALKGHTTDELIELGVGCLLHDVGMLLVPERILNSSQPITSADRLELQKHPIYTANLLQSCRDFPHPSRHVAYQMHERLNGSGYPRGRSGSQIHPLAQIAAVADTYLSLVSPRPYREALLPYHAVERILFSTRQGLFDASVVRALLHTISLFPLDSLVRLSDGRIARVIRIRPEHYHRPVVEIIDPMSAGTAEVIELSQRTNLTVVGVTAPLERTVQDNYSASAELLHAAASLSG